MSETFIVIFSLLMVMSLGSLVFLVKEALARRLWPLAIAFVGFWLLVLGF